MSEHFTVKDQEAVRFGEPAQTKSMPNEAQSWIPTPAMLTDLYEFTMAQAYFHNQMFAPTTFSRS